VLLTRRELARRLKVVISKGPEVEDVSHPLNPDKDSK
jgi:hypothetical protein